MVEIMSFPLVPQYSFRNITDVSPAFLDRLGIKFLMIDMDNTIASYGQRLPSDDVKRWAAEMKDFGVELFIVSNSSNKSRVERFAETFGIGFIMRAFKPSPRGLLRAMATSGYSADQSSLIGDQVFTDALSANLAGVVSMVVRPLRIKNPLLALRYALEIPFRAFCKNRNPLYFKAGV